MIRFLAAFLFLVSPLWGQTADIRGNLITAPDSVPVGRTFVARIKGDIPFTVEPEGTAAVELLDRSGNLVLLITAGEKPITISVSYQVAHPTAKEFETAPLDDKEKFLKEWLPEHNRDEIYQDSHTVKIGNAPDPDPPGPDPDPDPDEPAPIPEPGFRVLILYESEAKEKLPLLQKAVVYGTEVRKYLKEACVTEPDGGRAFRIYDKDQDVSGDYPVWKNAMERKPNSVPWVLISNGKTGYEGPLPESPSKFIELCKKYEVK